MDFKDQAGGARQAWAFRYAAQDVRAAATAKRDYRMSRAEWWEDQKRQVMDEIRASGIEVQESLASNYASNAGVVPQLKIRTDLQTKLAECHGKIRAHREAAREYDGWVQVLEREGGTLELRYADYLYFFGRDE